MRLGEERDYESQKDGMLYDWEGLINVEVSHPDEMYLFIEDQCRRFNVQIPPEEFICTVVREVIGSVSWGDPYFLFWNGLTDIQYTDDWRTRTYEIKEFCGDDVFECDPTKLETFKYYPDPSWSKYHDLLSRPGLKSTSEGRALWDYVDGTMSGEHILNYLSSETMRELKDMCGGRYENMEAYVDLVGWAAFVWIIGPEAADFRANMNCIFDACYVSGDCILYQGNVFTPNEYRVFARAPQSCVICGLDAWCVETVYLDGVTRHICEHHTTPQPISPYHCGTKLCRYTECPHHPMFGKGMNQLDYVRTVYGHQQNMVEWSGGRRNKMLSAS